MDCECIVCQKIFSQAIHIKTYEQFYTWVKDYKYITLSGDIVSKWSPEESWLTCNGVKDYKCITCKKRFSYRVGLTHAQVKDYIMHHLSENFLLF